MRVKYELRYSMENILDLLDRAKRLGFSLEKDSPLAKLTIIELDHLVTRKENEK